MTNLQVIGAGLGRTGTMSMKLALEEIGFGPCHHMVVTFGQEGCFKYFNNILKDKEVEESIKAVFKDFVAAVDYPGCMFYEELMKLNPDAKVILNVRDSPEAWAKSSGDTIFSANQANWLVSQLKVFMFQMFMPIHLYLIHKIMEKQSVHGVAPTDPDTDLAQMYTDWNNRVIETVPAEKLLIFNVKEGWKPLCYFLGVPVPDTPFPRVNSTEQWQNKVSGMMKGNILNALTRVVVAGLIFACGYYLLVGF
ncbi:uncharacterized protein LOC134820735 [Bolinopsis microptera]|uniref:uncharacterized protein LOC134820735 n=1 Tax=Bolinopsis microptera TaxID=2820187 RepID=UPI00307AA86C